MTLKRYTTKYGDTLHKISLWFYYRWDLWPLIFYYNDSVLSDPYDVPSPVQLEIPFPDALTTQLYHVAAKGDSSISLSQKYYGVTWYYKHIDAANNFPPKLKEGEEYIIPALCEQIEIQAAEELRFDIGITSVI